MANRIFDYRELNVENLGKEANGSYLLQFPVIYGPFAAKPDPIDYIIINGGNIFKINKIITGQSDFERIRTCECSMIRTAEESERIIDLASSLKAWPICGITGYSIIPQSVS